MLTHSCPANSQVRAVTMKMSDTWSEFGARRDDVFVCQVRHDNANAWNQSHNIMMKNYNLTVVQSCHFIRTTILFIHALYCTRIDFSMNFATTTNDCLNLFWHNHLRAVSSQGRGPPKKMAKSEFPPPNVYNLPTVLHTSVMLCPEAHLMS